jgi:hypothetical protein
MPPPRRAATKAAAGARGGVNWRLGRYGSGWRNSAAGGGRQLARMLLEARAAE